MRLPRAPYFTIILRCYLRLPHYILSMQCQTLFSDDLLQIQTYSNRKYNFNQMQSKNIVITGGNAGIGLETARCLFADGHHIVFGSRNQQKNASAVQSIAKSFPNSKGSIRSLPLDLSKRRSVESFAEGVKKKFSHIDILINNAGVMMNQKEVNEQGVEMTMATNHFGHFLLTYLLFPLLRQSKEARIINVSSALHSRSSEDTSADLSAQQSFSSFSTYGKSKLANVQFTVGLAERLAKYPNIKVMSLHPGIVSTDFGSGNTGLGCFKFLCCCFYVDNQTGARTSLFLSRTDFASLKSGEYYDNDTELTTMSQLGRNKEHVDRLWKTSEDLYKIQFNP